MVFVSHMWYFCCFKEELAERISECVHSFQNFDTAISFIRAFFTTEVREWSGTDRLRIDKFMMVSDITIVMSSELRTVFGMFLFLFAAF